MTDQLMWHGRDPHTGKYDPVGIPLNVDPDGTIHWPDGVKPPGRITGGPGTAPVVVGTDWTRHESALRHTLGHRPGMAERPIGLIRFVPALIVGIIMWGIIIAIGVWIVRALT